MYVHARFKTRSGYVPVHMYRTSERTAPVTKREWRGRLVIHRRRGLQLPVRYIAHAPAVEGGVEGHGDSNQQPQQQQQQQQHQQEYHHGGEQS